MTSQKHSSAQSVNWSQYTPVQSTPSTFFIGNITNAASKKTAKGASLTEAIVIDQKKEPATTVYFLLMSLVSLVVLH
ncbi:hypothetical protein MtrunA17_Chr3g0111091 [Medicago truncatula]|uniref:Uncharacterized protein n=1 Tax=Medicago truncatula TaxID=3880 RepID=A0A396IUQ1_MEDTR|nr:hypothetical protein MtrunA17_Chr3g0111091 [Medicago truncatula]